MRHRSRRQFGLLLLWLCLAAPLAFAQQPTPALLAEAAARLDRNDAAGAEMLLKKALAAAPRSAEAQTLAGVAAARQDKLAEAERHFAAAVRLKPASPEIRNNYGAILVRRNRPREASREFEASLRLNPNQPSALVNLAQIRFNEATPASLAAARELFGKALTLAPDVEIARALVVTDLKSKDAGAAARAYQDYARLAAGANLPFAARFELGAALMESNLVNEAVSELEAALALDAGHVEARVVLSRAYLKQKEIKKAGRLLESAVAAGAGDARLYAALAEVYQAGGYFENAIPAMRLAIERDPRNELYRIRYGMLLIDSKAPAAAIIRLEEAVKEFPASPRLLLALGIAQQVDGKSAEAQFSFERARQLAPDSVPVLAYLALVLDEKGQYAEAAAMTARALAVEEKNAVLHYMLADTLLKMPAGDSARAEKHLRRAIELDAALALAHLALGRLLTRGNRWAEAAAIFAQAARLAPELPDAQYQLGRALARLKRADESKAAFEKFKQLSESRTAQKETTRRELVERLANTRF